MATQQSPSQDQINLVGKGTVFEGTVRAESDVRASGRIVGTLRVEGKAMIAEEGAVDGEVIATNADIAGRVQGEIEVEERLVLKSTAQIEGTIETDRLVVEEGAEFTGECTMGTPVDLGGESEAAATANGEPGSSSSSAALGDETTEDDEEASTEPTSQ